MREEEAYRVIDFIIAHYDMVSQEEWFEFCDMVLNLIAHQARAQGSAFAANLANDYPELFSASSGK